MAELHDKEIFNGDVQEMQNRTLKEVIDFLQELAAAQPCPSSEVTVQFRQFGDHWDGYDCATIAITREETPDEAEAREAEWARDAIQREAQKGAHERALLAQLLAKHGGSNG